MFRRRSSDDFSEEIQSHLDLETDRLIEDGVAPAEARDTARRAFGNATLVRERFYEESRWPWLDQLVQDVKYAFRTLLQNRGFFATTVLTLAVGIGLATTAFTAFNAYVLRPYAIQDPGTLYKVTWHLRDEASETFRWREYEAISAERGLFTHAIAESTRYVSSNGRPFAVALVSNNYFEGLAPRILLGRGLASFDDTADAIVLSEQAWKRLFDRDPAILGRAVDIAGHRFTIVGVAEAEFTGLGDLPRDGWLPFTSYARLLQPALLGREQPAVLQVFVRVADPFAIPRVDGALGPVLTEALHSAEPVRVEVRAQRSPNPMSPELLVVLSPVLVMFALVLVTACANVSNVMLARAVARHREIAVRLSLGAARGRIVRQLMTEGAVIAAIAGVLALALAAWTLRAVTQLVFSTLPPSIAGLLRAAPMGLDRRVFLFAVAIAAVSTLMFALVPALQGSRLALTDALRGQGGDGKRSSRLRSLLVAGQVAVSLVLVVIALTLARNGAAVSAIDLGFDPKGVLSINVRERRTDLVRPLAETLMNDRRAASVVVTGGNPLFRSDKVAAAPISRPAAVPTRYSFVSAGYFDLLALPVTQGRGFTEQECATEARVAVISDVTAAAFWPGEAPLGKVIRLDPPNGRAVDELPGHREAVVVGVVPDVVSGIIVAGKDKGHIYLPTSAAGVHGTALLVRPRTGRDLDTEALQGIFSRAAADPQAFEAVPLEEMRELQVYPLLVASWLGSVLGAVALVLSVSGLYGVLAYTFGQRTREIGIRMALGATVRSVVTLVLLQSARLAGYGAACGLLVALGAMLGLASVIQLPTLHIVDVGAFAAAVLVVLAATAVAAWQPARRAARIDPALTLRADG